MASLWKNIFSVLGPLWLPCPVVKHTLSLKRTRVPQQREGGWVQASSEVWQYPGA